jgi:hypothetical protein
MYWKKNLMLKLFKINLTIMYNISNAMYMHDV